MMSSDRNARFLALVPLLGIVFALNGCSAASPSSTQTSSSPTSEATPSPTESVFGADAIKALETLGFDCAKTTPPAGTLWKCQKGAIDAQTGLAAEWVTILDTPGDMDNLSGSVSENVAKELAKVGFEGSYDASTKSWIVNS